MRIALAQINPTVGDFAGNLRLIERDVRAAQEAGAELVVFPELAVCGYPPQDLLEKESFLRQCEASVEAVAKLTMAAGAPSVIVGAAMRHTAAGAKRAKNCAVLLEDGQVKFVQQKMLLPYYDVFDEQRYFEPGTRQTLALVKGRPVAITVCEDAWNDKVFWPRQLYAVDPVEELMKQWAMLPQPIAGERIIVNISASPYWHGKGEVRRKMIGAIAQRHGAAMLMVNQIGGNDSLIFDGQSVAVNAAGEPTALLKAFAEGLVVIDTAQAQAITVTESEDTETERMWCGLVLGTRDYVRKCGFTKALVGLSGGIDSALVAAVAVEALGAENVEGIGMPSAFSSEGSVTDAERLAKNLGIRYTVLPIGSIYEGFTKELAPFFAGTAFGLAEENIQPRVRGTLLMAVSNKTGALVLTTGNKSEMACGYCTLYGDMVGALAVIGDVYKTEVYTLCRWLNRQGEVIPEATLTKPPSAELRPGQKDTDSLPPYDELDPILREYIEAMTPAEEIARKLNVDLETVLKIIRLVEISEYKRQQAAPVLKLTRKSFGAGRRFPIAARR